MGHRRFFDSPATLLLGFALMMACGASAIWLNGQQRIAERWIRHTFQVIGQLDQIEIAATRIELDRRARDRSMPIARPEIAMADRQRLGAAIDAVASLTADNVQQQNGLGGLRLALRGIRAAPPASRPVNDPAIDGPTRWRVALTRLRDTEQRLLHARLATSSRLQFTGLLVLGSSLVLACLLGAFAFLDRRRRLALLGEVNAKLEIDNRKLEIAEAECRATLARLSNGNQLLMMAQAMGKLGHWRLNLADNAMIWSDEILRIYGFEPGTSPTIEAALALYHPDDLARVQANLQAARAGGRGYQAQARIVRTDGRIVHILTRAEIEFDDAGLAVALFGIVQDVTEQVIARAEVHEQQRQYRLLADHSSDMIVRIGLDGVRRYVSPASLGLLGYLPEEMVGGTPVAAIHPDDRARVVEVCRSLLDGVEDAICSYRQRHRDGYYVWLEAAYRLIRGADGEPTEFVASVRDIRRRHDAEIAVKEASANLQESHRLFSMAASLARVGHWRVDLGSGTVSWSDEVYRIYGVEPDHVPTLDNAIDVYQPGDRERVRSLVDEATTNGTPFHFAATLVLGDGTTKPVAVQGQAERAPDATVIGIIGVIQDVSAQVEAQEALRDSEQQYRLLADNATDVVLRTADDGTVLYVSPSCIELSGFMPGELVGHHSAEFIHPDQREAVHTAHLAIITGVQTVATVRYRLRQKNRGWRWLESNMRGWQGPDGTRAGVISAIRDIEARQELEAELVAARQVAEAAAHAKSAFLANMSHEIRTPMNGVVGFTELLLADELSDVQRRRAELIADSGRSMVRLLNDILDLSKIEAGQMTVACEPFDLHHALKACVRLVKPAVEQKGIRLEADLSTALPQMVLGDGLRLRQIILNLLGNAAKFTAEGLVTLRARLVRQADGNRVVIEVEDSGPGIAPDRQAAIFERFVQADAAVAPAFGGTGLGLPISVQLARLMGGDIALESEPGRGSRFILSLPLALADVAPVPALVADAADASDDRPLAPSLRVLVAEDHDVNQLLIAAMLERLGCVAEIAGDGEQALAMIAAADADARPYAVVLMDMQMPVLGGIEATRRLRASGHDAARLPVVALTANAYADDVAACLNAGMQAHLAKPVRLRDLEMVLRRWAVPATPSPASVGLQFSAEIRDRYRLRRAETLRKVDEMVRLGAFEGAAVDEVADLLHKLAGTAGMFGETALGECARLLELGLLTWPAETRAEQAQPLVTALRAAA